MKLATQLKWGESPWDDESRERLLQLVQAYHSTATSMALALRSAGDIDQPSYREAIAKFDYLRTLAGDNHPEGSLRIREGFFRYADSFLFPEDVGLKFIWFFCASCRARSFVDSTTTELPLGKPCSCGGAWRKIQREDLQPKPSNPV